ncbi:hypothetical protein IWQ61_005453 [Dispira simplex]|nr:hypothetical protein IWQ61_005453 [Dispira simplex]
MSTSQKSPSVPDWITQIHNNHPHFAAPAVLASELTPETVPRILAQWSQLDSGSKFVVLFTPLLIKKHLQVAYKEPLQQLFALAVEDSDPWISATAKLLQSYPQQGTFNFHTEEITQLKVAAQEALQGGSLEFYPREHAYYNLQLAHQLTPPALRDPVHTNASATFNVSPKSRVSHTDRLETLKRLSLEATTTSKTTMFSGPPSVFRPSSRVSPTVSHFPPTTRSTPGVRPPTGATPATGLMANRSKPPGAGLLRPSAPRPPSVIMSNRPVARTGVAPPPGRYQRQTRIQLMDMSEANDIDKQRKEALEKKKEDERLAKESRRSQKMREAEERKQRELERKLEQKREREERRQQKLKQKEEEAAGRQRKPRGRPKVARVQISDDEHSSALESGEVDEAADVPITVSPTDSSPNRTTHKKRRLTTPSPNEPDDDLPDYEEERDVSPVMESVGTNQVTTVLPSSELEVIPPHPVPSSSSPPPTTIIRDFSNYPSHLRPLFDTIFSKCNVLLPADQRLIMDFLASNPNLVVPPLEEGRYYRAPIHQEKVFDKASANYALECIEFEIDYKTGEWRQVKRRTMVNE